MILQTDTICALITPPGRGTVGVIRISGMKTLKLFQKYLLQLIKLCQLQS